MTWALPSMVAAAGSIGVEGASSVPLAEMAGLAPIAALIPQRVGAPSRPMSLQPWAPRTAIRATTSWKTQPPDPVKLDMG